MRLRFAPPAVGAHASNPADYEQHRYDAADNLVSRRLRDCQTFAFADNTLNRQTV